MPKKQKRIRRRDDPRRWFLRRYQRWFRRLGVLAALAVAAAVLWFLVDPLQGAPTAIDANGQEVATGVIDRPGASASTGSLAPNFLLADYDRRAVRLDQFEGKVVFVNFWASWCEFCEQEMPDIMRVAQQYPDDLVVLAVNRGEGAGRAKSWTGGHNFPDLANVHWLLDPNEDVVDKYRVDGMPQSFFVDQNGIVRQGLRRVSDYSEMLDVVRSILGDSVSS